MQLLLLLSALLTALSGTMTRHATEPQQLASTSSMEVLVRETQPAPAAIVLVLGAVFAFVRNDPRMLRPLAVYRTVAIYLQRRRE